MVTRIVSNFATTDYQVQAQMLYHWLTYVNGFAEVQASGSAWSTVFYSNSNGVINSATPQAFYAASSSFDGTFVNKHIAIRDASNPSNCTIARITAAPTSTQLTLDSSAVLNINSADVQYRVFDTATPPADSDFFVIQNPSGLSWQARCFVDGVSSSLYWQLGFVGGWNVGSGTWTLPVSSDHYLHSTLAQTFCVADSAVGFVYIWSEDVGGLGSDRNALWLGSLSPFHSPSEVGVSKDLSYSAIFGSPTASVADNLSRDTTVTNNFCVGEGLSASNSVIPLRFAQKRLLSTGVDMLTVAAAATNPRSSEQDDYDVIVFHRTPDQAWRGRVPGVRILNDNISNRTPINGNGTYVLGNGIGSVWNGKAPLP